MKMLFNFFFIIYNKLAKFMNKNKLFYSFLITIIPAIGYCQNYNNHSFDKINTGDTAWIIISSILVLFMTIPGIALFYGGMVRKKNILATMMQSFTITSLITIIWFIIAYSLIFTDNNFFVGNFSKVFLKNVSIYSSSENMPNIPEMVFIIFQLTFAIISAAIITGSTAERIKFKSLMIFLCFWILFVYVPIAHWVWGGGWLSDNNIEKLTGSTIKDFAGGTVVHINAGVAGLIASLVIGKRIGYQKTAILPHNLSLTLIGVALLWIGWFGFNAGSAGAANAIAGLALLNTQIAACSGSLTWIFCENIYGKKPSALGFASGIVSGLVGITPAAGYVTPASAIIIGIITAVCCYFSVIKLKYFFKYDDSLDTFGIHGIGGIVGAILTGIFYSNTINEDISLVLVQILGVIVTIIYCGITSFIILKIIDKTIGIRISSEEENQGLDISSHGEKLE